MTQRRSRYLPIMGHEMHVSEWGNPRNPVLIMWHGLARTGRDFDECARAMSKTHFVICPDTIGRGLSSWSQQPKAHYHPAHYAQMALAMLDHYCAKQADWLGTSMGGLIGMHVIAGAGRDRIGRFIINDIGPEIPDAAIERIVTYASELPRFDSFSAAHSWLKTVYAPFGPAPEAFWDRMTETSLRRRDDGFFTLHYDPQIIPMLSHHSDQLDNWALWDRITLPTLVIQGSQSDILTDEILSRMRKSGPCPSVVIHDDCGHAPSLSTEVQIQQIQEFLAL